MVDFARKYARAGRVCAALVAVLTALACLYSVGIGQDIQTTDRVVYYDIEAGSQDGIEAQFLASGPNGFAATTKWHVSWDWKCRVSLDVTITYPRHVALDQLTDTQRQNWTRFMQRLRLHENMHRFDGVRAARDVRNNWCFGAHYIVKYWLAQSTILDLRTNHGRTDGVQLRL